jgi:hypothetical protein
MDSIALDYLRSLWAFYTNLSTMSHDSHYITFRLLFSPSILPIATNASKSKLIPTDPQLLHGPILLQTFEQMSQVLFRNLTRLQPQPLQGPIFWTKSTSNGKIVHHGTGCCGTVTAKSAFGWLTCACSSVQWTARLSCCAKGLGA